MTTAEAAQTAFSSNYLTKARNKCDSSLHKCFFKNTEGSTCLVLEASKFLQYHGCVSFDQKQSPEQNG